MSDESRLILRPSPLARRLMGGFGLVVAGAVVVGAIVGVVPHDNLRQWLAIPAVVAIALAFTAAWEFRARLESEGHIVAVVPPWGRRRVVDRSSVARLLVTPQQTALIGHDGVVLARFRGSPWSKQELKAFCDAAGVVLVIPPRRTRP